MTKKEARRAERRKKAVKTALIPLVFGLVMLGLGIFGLLRNNRDLREYQNSADRREVEASVTYVEIKQDKPLPNELPEYYWDADLVFTVDGKEYKDEIRRYSELKQGDKLTVEVYQTGSGEYRIPTVKTETGNTLSNLLMYAAIAVGGVILLASLFYLFSELRAAKSKGNPPPR